MNRSLKTVLMGLALVLFVGSFYLKQLIPASPDIADGIVKSAAIAILLFIVIKQRIRKKPTDPL
ncbi:MAG TPA: hypothetical protein VHE34_05400 [Puia sp.]|uniref:hypothetical protein n=1 Tax=Puia sp. TaxID=2045100 RepID=UPI002CE0AE2B|nr:hypothetical protein [Puia sp.]HVU94636.1 hypothetical protein [Puia sp.]